MHTKVKEGQVGKRKGVVKSKKDTREDNGVTQKTSDMYENLITNSLLPIKNMPIKVTPTKEMSLLQGRQGRTPLS